MGGWVAFVYLPSPSFFLLSPSLSSSIISLNCAPECGGCSQVTSPRERERIERLGLTAQIRDGRLFGVLAVSRSFGDSALKARQTRARTEDREAQQAAVIASAAASAAAAPTSATASTAAPPPTPPLASGAVTEESAPDEREALVAVPEVTKTKITAQDEFVVVASDGVWDVLGSQKALNFVRRRLRTHKCAQRAAGELVAEALALGSHDNTSALVVMFHQVAIPAAN